MAAVQKVKEATALQLAALLDAGDGAVVTLVAGDTRLAAHRAVLMDRSPVFAAMFGHDMLEASSGEVTITDVEGPVLRQLLAYVYTLQAPQLSDMAPQLLAAADKYGVSSLKAACEQQVIEQLSVETAAAAAVLAVRHSCDSLRQSSIAFVKTHTHEVMATRGWADAMRSQPDDLIEVSWLVSEPLPDVRAPTLANSGTSSHAATHPHSGHSDQGQTAASGVPAMAASRRIPSPDDDAVSRLRHLPAQEKGVRLIQAADEGAVGELEALLAAGADVGARNEEGETALYLAAYMGHVEVARRLLAWGAAVEVRNKYQNTPLHKASLNGKVAVVQLLLDAGAYHSARGRNGWTPLHRAALGGYADVAAALLEVGADTRARDNEGKTPLDLARAGKHQRVVDIITGR